jgi:hypothetical protein
MRFDRKYLLCALGYAIVGMCLGIFMAASHDHVHRVTHAHILLVGFVVSFIYGIIHKLWLDEGSTTLAKVQFITHQLGAALMSAGLFLLYGGLVLIERIEPVLAISSLIVLLGALLMIVMVVKSNASAK